MKDIVNQVTVETIIADPERPITTEEASLFLGLSVSSLYKKTLKGDLPHYKKGRRLYFLRDELKSWILENKIS